MKITNTHVYFWGGLFSQWYPSLFYDSKYTLYNCAEQYMMAQKALLFDDPDKYWAIMSSKDPKEQKAIGRTVSNFDLDVWKENAKLIVYRGNYYKFNQNDKLKKELLNTESRYLVEASPYDKVWGVGLKEDDPAILDFNNWQGSNWLGEILVKVREDLNVTAN